MPTQLHASKNTRQITPRISTECFDALMAIRNAKGGTVTGVAQEILEACKTIKPENWHSAIAALQAEGRR